jgi:hypothetical protein
MIRFYGASDDLVEIEGPGIGHNFDRGHFEQHLSGKFGVVEHWQPTDEIYVEDNDQEHDCWMESWGVASSYIVGTQLIVHAIYDHEGHWSFAVAPVGDGEGIVLPPWNIRTGKSVDCKHSMELKIDAPAGTPVRRLGPNMEGSRPDFGAGTYRVQVVPPPEGHPLEGVREFVWDVNHRNHALNKAKKRGLVIVGVEKLED